MSVLPRSRGVGSGLRTILIETQNILSAKHKRAPLGEVVFAAPLAVRYFSRSDCSQATIGLGF